MATSIPHQEILPDRPKEPPVTLGGIEVQLKNLRERKVEKGRTTERAEAELEIIRRNIASLAKEPGVNNEQIQKLRTSLAELTQELDDRSRMDKLKGEVSPAEAEKTFLGIDSKTLTQAGTAIAVVGIGATLVVAWKALKVWLSRGRDVVGEKVKKGVSWLRWIGLATTGGLLTFFGLKVLQDRLMKGSLEKAEAEIKKKGEKAVGTIVASGKEGVTLVQGATKDLTGEAVAAVAGASTAAVSKAEDLKKKITPEAKELGEELKTMSKEEVTARIVIAQHTEEWNLDDVAKKNQLIGLINHPVNMTKTMNSIDERRDDPSGLALDIPDTTKDRVNREQSVNALLDYCDVHRPQVIDLMKHEKKCSDAEAEKYVGEMTLSTYLDYALRSSNAFVRAASELEKGAGSFAQLMETLKHLNFAYILKGDQYVEKEFKSIMSEARQADFGISDEEIEDINFIDLLQSAMSSSQGTVLDEQKRLESATTPSDKVLKFIYSKIIDESNTTHKVILPLFYDVFPIEKVGMTPEQIVRTYLLERMTPAEALRFYMYHRILSQGNAAVLPLMQIEVIRFIARHDKGPLQGTRKYTAMARMGGSLVWNGGGKIIEEWKKLNLNINIEITEEEQRMIKYVGSLIVASPFTGLIEHAKAVKGTVTAYPGTFALGVGTLAGSKVLYARGSPIVWGINLPEFKKLIDGLPDVNGPIGAGPKTMENLRQLLLGFTATNLEITEVRSVWETIFNEALKKYRDPKKVTEATEMFRQCIKQPRSAKNWATLAKELHDVAAKTGSHEILQAAKKAEEMSLPAAARLRRIYGAMAVGFKTSWRWAIFTVGIQPLVSATAVAIDRGVAKGIDVASRGAAAGVLRNTGKLLKFGAKGVPLVATVYEGGRYAIYEKDAMQKEFDAEKDPLKRKILHNEMLSKRLNIELGFLGSVGTFTPPGAVLFFGNMARQEANESINAGTRYMLQDRKSMKDYAPANLLHQIQKSAPKKKVTFGQWMASTRVAGLYEGNIQKMGTLVDSANTGTRSEAYAAYFQKSAGLPPVSAAMLTDAQAMDPTRSEQQMKILAQSQVSFFTQSALSYLSRVTNQTFVTVDPEVLHRALTYAYRCTIDWRLGMMGQATTFIQQEWPVKEAAITESMEREQEQRIAQAKLHLDNGENPQAVLPFYFLESIKDDLVMREADILGTNFLDWEYFWSFSHLTNDEEMQQITRSMYAQKLAAALETITTNTQPLTKENFEAGRQSLLRILKVDLETLALEGLESPKRARLQQTGMNAGLLSIEGMLEYLETYQGESIPTLEFKQTSKSVDVTGAPETNSQNPSVPKENPEALTQAL